MGTRSTTKIYDGKNLVLALYKQWDGYIEGGWGDELKAFVKSGKFVNGLPMDKKERLFNGIGCFALQLVKEFKTEAGDLYATTEDDEQEYNYKIVYNWDYDKRKGTLKISCLEDKSFNEITVSYTHLRAHET